MTFRDGEITGVQVRRFPLHRDIRGWLLELFRSDELPEGFSPAMAYISQTNPGVQRGPHEHRTQSDFLCFVGPSRFHVMLWDARKDSPTFKNRMSFMGGEEDPVGVLVPPGVVHAYRNVGSEAGYVVNIPDTLYAGAGRREPVDEIRHERDPQTPYVYSQTEER